MKHMVVIAGLLLAALSLGSTAAPQTEPPHVVLVTLDGVRTEEMFGGLDLEALTSTLGKDQAAADAPVYRKFWASSAEERRRKVMPFFWTLMAEHGSIAGNRALGSFVGVRNTHWFSYPGYAEILLGEARDAEIKSNDPIRNPFPTVLEGIRDGLSLAPGAVATFASWPIFTYIVEHEEGRTFVNAGVRTLGATEPETQVVDRMQHEVRTPWPGTRFDAFTFRLAMSYLASARPRVLYIAFDETDDWAHDGRYDLVLESLAQTDAFLRELWTWLQNDEEYRGRTHLLITTDHGRGHTAKDWRRHGADVPGSNETWIAMVSPTMKERGERRGGSELSTSQIASTIALWMGIDWNANHPAAGGPIQ